MDFLRFLAAGLRAMATGGPGYKAWVLLLALLSTAGFACWGLQLRDGLVLTGMSDQVSWGFYICNFAFLVGIAAAAVLLVIPAYVFHRADVKAVVLIGEGLATAAVIAAMMFVLADLGRLDRAWHLLPVIGRFNWPDSLLAWDVVVLNGYLALNVALPLHVHWRRWQGRDTGGRVYFIGVVVAMFWAISIHTVTAFLFSANTARPFWHTSLLGPRFIASAFVSGPALIILVLQVLRRRGGLAVGEGVIDLLALVMTVALQASLFFVLAEVFTDFYNETTHAASMRYLLLGLDGHAALAPWIRTALVLNGVALAILMIHPLRRRRPLLNLACGLAFVGIWIEKGMGLVVPGFIPTPLGEVFEYTPSAIELGLTLGIWAFGALVFTLLAQASLGLERRSARRGEPPVPAGARPART